MPRKMTFEEQPEEAIVKKIRKALQGSVGGFWFKVHGGPFQMAGLPDLLGCVQGRFIGIEVKRPSRMTNVSPIQQHVIRKINLNGGLAIVSCDPDTAVEEVTRFLSTP